MSNYSDSSFDPENSNTSWYKVFHSIDRDTKVLDIGCSSGNFGKELINRRNCIVDGIEINTSDAKEARKNLRTVYELNIETDDLGVIKDRYDTIYFGDVIEHLVDPVEALKKVKSLLKKDGNIVFSIPNMAFIGVRLDLLDGNFDYTETGLLDKTHLHFYTKKEIERVFAEAGFVINQFDYVMKDYPKAVIKKELKKVGLTASEKFFKKAASIEASAFQFVGKVSIGSPDMTPIKRKQFGPVDLFESFYNDTVANHKLEVARLEKEIKTLRSRPLRTWWEQKRSGSRK